MFTLLGIALKGDLELLPYREFFLVNFGGVVYVSRVVSFIRYIHIIKPSLKYTEFVFAILCISIIPFICSLYFRDIYRFKIYIITLFISTMYYISQVLENNKISYEKCTIIATLIISFIAITISIITEIYTNIIIITPSILINVMYLIEKNNSNYRLVPNTKISNYNIKVRLSSIILTCLFMEKCIRFSGYNIFSDKVYIDGYVNLFLNGLCTSMIIANFIILYIFSAKESYNNITLVNAESLIMYRVILLSIAYATVFVNVV